MKHVDYYKEYEDYIINDKPIPYGDLLIYPVLWSDIYKFTQSYDVLVLDDAKDSIPDVKVASLTYLEFIILISQEEVEWLNKLINIFCICLHFEESKIMINIDENGKFFFSYGDLKIKDKDFEKIRRIIMYQNIIDYDDTYIDPEVKQEINKYYALKNEGIVSPSLEHKKAILMGMGFSFNQIKEMTYREAQWLIDVENSKWEYFTTKIIRCIPYVESKKIELEHWIYKNKKDKFGEVFTDYDMVKNKYAQAGVQ